MRHTTLLTTALLISTAFAPSIAYSQTPATQSPATTAPTQWPANTGQANQEQANPAVAASPKMEPTASAIYAAPATPAEPVTTTASTALDSVGGDAIPPLPLEVESSNGVTYINGGVGDEELAEFKSKGGEFNLHVMLTASKGEYISDVNLQILDKKGTLLVSVDDAGPYFYAHLQPGTYTMETSGKNGGMTKKIKLNIKAKGTVKENIVLTEQGGVTTPHVPETKLE